MLAGYSDSGTGLKPLRVLPGQRQKLKQLLITRTEIPALLNAAKACVSIGSLRFPKF
jgi:hypothetical protein